MTLTPPGHANYLGMFRYFREFPALSDRLSSKPSEAHPAASPFDDVPLLPLPAWQPPALLPVCYRLAPMKPPLGGVER
jgi:hypothetical protein